MYNFNEIIPNFITLPCHQYKLDVTVTEARNLFLIHDDLSLNAMNQIHLIKRVTPFTLRTMQIIFFQLTQFPPIQQVPKYERGKIELGCVFGNFSPCIGY